MAPPPTLPAGYGSCLVPREDAVTAFGNTATAVLERVSHGTDSVAGQIDLHNLFTAIGLIFWGFATASRPVCDGDYGGPLGRATGTRMIHLDKRSARSCDPRTQQVIPELSELRKEFAKARRAAIQIDGFDGVRFQELGEPLIFFLTQRVRPATATSEWVRYVFRLYPELTNVFPFALNVGRHALATMLAELELEPALRRYGLGHQRNHAESLSRFSLALIRHYETAFATAASGWLQRCHLTVPRFPSRGVAL